MPELEKIEELLEDSQYENVIEILTALIPGFRHQSGIVDHLDAYKNKEPLKER